MNNTYLNKFKAGEYVDPALLEYEKLQNLQSENQKKAEETERLETLYLILSRITQNLKNLLMTHWTRKEKQQARQSLFLRSNLL